MKTRIPARLFPCIVTSLSVIALAPFLAAPPAQAQTAEELAGRIDRMEQDLQAMRLELSRALQETAKAQQEATAAKNEAAAAGKDARAQDYAASNWHFAGYAHTSFLASDLPGHDSFLAGGFNPVFHYQYQDLVMFEGELEFETNSTGGTNTELEYASIDVFAHDNLTVVAGKFLSPLGRFQEDLHPAWINKMPDRPAGFSNAAGAFPLSEVGLMLRGGATIDPVMVNYSVYAGNGPQVELTGGELEKVSFEGVGEDDDNGNKAVGGRFGILPIPGLEVGGSFLVSSIDGKNEGVSGGTSSGDFAWYGADLSYTRYGADLRFEWFTSQLDSFFSQTAAATATGLVPTTDWEAWYAQLAYRLNELTDDPIVGNFEPVVRYGQFDIEGFGNFVTNGEQEDRLSVGLNYWFTPSLVVKNAASWRDFRNAGAANGMEYRVQLAYGF